MKTKKIIPTVFALLCVTGAFYYETIHAKGEKELIMGFALSPFLVNTSFAGKGSAGAREIAQTVGDEFEKLYGYKLTLQIYPSPKFLFKALQTQQADFAFLSIALYLYAKNHGVPVHPLFVATTTGKKGQQDCVYVHKDSGIKNVQQLQGRVFARDFPVFLSKKDALPPKESYIYWIILKKMLIQNGVNKPFKDFFKEFKVIPVPVESTAYGVMIKMFDACLMAPPDLLALKLYDKGFSSLVPVARLENPMPAPFVYRDGLSPELLQKAKSYFFSPPKGSQLEKILKKAYKGFKLIPAEEKDYAMFFKWLKEAEQKAWLKEFDEIMAMVMKESKDKGKSKYIYEGEK